MSIFKQSLYLLLCISATLCFAKTAQPFKPVVKPEVKKQKKQVKIVREYYVQKGDFPERIARKHGVRLADLLRANNLTEASVRKLKVGQKLIIPPANPDVVNSQKKIKQQQDALNQGIEYFNQKKYQKAIDSLNKADTTAAKTINYLGKAYNHLALLYCNGQVGGKRDYVKAKELFEMAIEYNNADAMNNLAFMYENGHIDGTRDYVKAEELYEMAIKYNNAAAMNNLAFMYENGHIDGKEDYVKAKEYYEMAIKYNHADAMYNLGMLYANGHIDGKRDYVKAKEYYEMAIKYNNASAMLNLGMLYYNGRVGGKRDYKKALTLFNNAVNANELVRGNFGIGMIYEKEDKLRMAEKYYKLAQQALTESDPPFLHEGIKNKLKIVENLNLGFVYLQKGNYKEAKECFQKAKILGSDKANDALNQLEIYMTM